MLCAFQTQLCLLIVTTTDYSTESPGPEYIAVLYLDNSETFHASVLFLCLLVAVKNILMCLYDLLLKPFVIGNSPLVASFYVWHLQMNENSLEGYPKLERCLLHFECTIWLYSKANRYVNIANVGCNSNTTMYHIPPASLLLSFPVLIDTK